MPINDNFQFQIIFKVSPIYLLLTSKRVQESWFLYFHYFMSFYNEHRLLIGERCEYY